MKIENRNETESPPEHTEYTENRFFVVAVSVYSVCSVAK